LARVPVVGCSDMRESALEPLRCLRMPSLEAADQPEVPFLRRDAVLVAELGEDRYRILQDRALRREIGVRFREDPVADQAAPDSRYQGAIAERSCSLLDLLEDPAELAHPAEIVQSGAVEPQELHPLGGLGRHESQRALEE